MIEPIQTDPVQRVLKAADAAVKNIRETAAYIEANRHLFEGTNLQDWAFYRREIELVGENNNARDVAARFTDVTEWKRVLHYSKTAYSYKGVIPGNNITITIDRAEEILPAEESVVQL